MFGKSSTATLPAQTSNLPAQIAALISPRYCLATVLHANQYYLQRHSGSGRKNKLKIVVRIFGLYCRKYYLSTLNK
jgi:hypothetical protein